MEKKNNFVYVIHAAAQNSTDPYALDTHAVANSYELAEKIAKQDEADGQIYEGWTISKTYLNTSEADICIS